MEIGTASAVSEARRGTAALDPLQSLGGWLGNPRTGHSTQSSGNAFAPAIDLVIKFSPTDRFYIWTLAGVRIKRLCAIQFGYSCIGNKTS
jgi:hypothetical protein